MPALWHIRRAVKGDAADAGGRQITAFSLPPGGVFFLEKTHRKSVKVD